MVVGSGSYPEALEQAIIGLKVGDEKVVTLTPDQAFGPKRQELVARVAKDQLPPQVVNASPGEILSATGQNGQPIVMRVIEVDSATVAQFLGRLADPGASEGEPVRESGFRALLFVDMVGSTDITRQGTGSSRASSLPTAR